MARKLEQTSFFVVGKVDSAQVTFLIGLRMPKIGLKKEDLKY